MKHLKILIAVFSVTTFVSCSFKNGTTTNLVEKSN